MKQNTYYARHRAERLAYQHDYWRSLSEDERKKRNKARTTRYRNDDEYREGIQNYSREFMRTKRQQLKNIS